MVIRPDAVGVLRNLLHRTRLKHPVVAVVHPLAVRLLLLGFIPVGIGNQLHQIEIHPHLRLQLGFDALQLGGVKTLQVDFVLLAGVAVLFEHLQRLRGNVFPFLMVEPWGFDFRVDADVFTGGVVQSLNKLNLFLEGMDPEVRFAHRETSRIDLHLLAVFNLEAFGELQGADLRQREVNGVEAAIFAGAIRETLCHVRHAVKIMVVQDDQLVVLRHHQILLQVIRPLRIGHRFCRQRMLWQIAARTAVGNNDFIRRQRGACHQARQQQAGC